QHRKRFRCHLAADRVEDSVAAFDYANKVLRGVVDDFIGAQVADIVDIAGAGGAYHARADMFGKLDREACDAAGTALNEDGLAALQLESGLDGDDGGQA